MFRVAVACGIRQVPSIIIPTNPLYKYTIMELTNVKKLLIHELQDLYSAESQLLVALPKMAKGASNPELKAGFLDHLEETKVQVERLDQIFDRLKASPKGEVCKGMQGLIKEGEKAMEEEGMKVFLDSALIIAAQKVEHYEISGYGSVLHFARMLDDAEIVSLLEATLEEEYATDEKLTEISLSIIDPEGSFANADSGKRQSVR